MSSLLIKLEGLGFTARKISTTDGGEYSSPCPACGDGGKGRESDRFHIWPEKENKGLCRGRYWCRQCDISGDTISFLQKFYNLDFQSACVELGIQLPKLQQANKKRFQPSAELPQTSALWVPRVYPSPPHLWQEKAEKLLAYCQDCLQLNPEHLDWLQTRGISPATAATFGLGFNVSSNGGDRYRAGKAWGLHDKNERNGKKKKLWIPRGWVIPAFDESGRVIQLRVRRLNEDIEKFGFNIKYFPIAGSSMASMVVYPDAEIFVVVECGFDAILVASCFDGSVGAVTTWNASARPDRRTHKLLSRSSLILNGLDYDKAGEKEQAWWNAVYKQNCRLVQPAKNIGDPGEAYEAGVDIRAWVIASMPRGIKIKLGFDKKKTVKPPTHKEEKTPEELENDKNDSPVVVEVTLSNGKIIYLTDDQDEWQSLSDQRKPVFSKNELERLKSATSTMGEKERLAAAMQAIEIKEMFGGYIKGGQVKWKKIGR